MARPPKQNVDYFPHDADASEGRTVSIIENHFGAEGYATWFKLLERISRANNHIITCSNGEDTEFMAAKLKLQPEKMLLILDKLAELEAIDPELWARKVIWCQNLVDRLKDAYKNRRQELPQKPIVTDNLCFECGKLLVGMREDAKYCSDNCRIIAHRRELSVTLNTPDNLITTPDNLITTPDNLITTPDNPQSKLKEKKRNNKDNFILPDWINKTTWDDFLEMRKKLRKPPTDRAKRELIKDLEKLKETGCDVDEVILRSVKNGWLAFYPPDSKNAGRGKTDKTEHKSKYKAVN